MRYHVTVRDRTYVVDLNGATVSVDGERLEAHWAQVPGTPLVHLLLGTESWTVACQQLDDAGRRWALGAVGERFEQAMAATDVTRDALSGSFDLLMSRVAQRTNDTVRVLTVVSVSLLPATLVTGVLGMNFHPSFFDHARYFWLTVVAIAVVVAGVLVTARHRHWV